MTDQERLDLIQQIRPVLWEVVSYQGFQGSRELSGDATRWRRGK
jgi:hypothetical protein